MLEFIGPVSAQIFMAEIFPWIRKVVVQTENMKERSLVQMFKMLITSFFQTNYKNKREIKHI